MPTRCAWPEPADPDAALRLLERLALPHGGGTLAQHLPALRALGGGSPYLSDLLVRERDTAVAVFERGPDAVAADALAALAGLPPTTARAALAAALRAAKRQVALVCALADIGGAWPLATVTATLSRLACLCVGKAVDHLLLDAVRTGALRPADPDAPHPDQPGRGSGLIVLGMGKLGADELNYSSDIDLILFYDPEQQVGVEGLGASFTRLAKALVALLETRDADGYVFRTDLRLRPDPAATPPVVALPAALGYYESMGQNWERAAMTKARPIAGDIEAGLLFLAQIRPFVWRRGLDFAAIADIHAMKRRINEHRQLGPAASLAGFDLKQGVGGIREIEFAAQTLQLVWGGRDPRLRDPTTLGALRRLVRAGKLDRRAAAELTVAYRVLRRVEHRLQMVADRQTHSLPSKPEELARFAVFMGCADTDAFAAALQAQLARVRRRYAEVFEAVPEPQPGKLALDLSGTDDPPATVAALRALGFHNTHGAIATLRGWVSGRYRALRSERARELLREVLPAVLEALGGQSEPDAVLNRFDGLLSRLPAGVQLLSMFRRNPALLGRVADVLGAAPPLAEHLASEPQSLEGLLAPHALDPDPAQTLAMRLHGAHALEEVILVTRAYVRAEEFRLSVGQMEGWIDADAAGAARAAVADAALGALLAVVLRDHTVRHGAIRGGAVALVALGKSGSREMMAGSDLDLMLVYSHPPQANESAGPRRLPASTWFIRAAHAFIAAVTAPGRDGPLYAVDMRLRPSGNKGPVAVSLPAFRRYHAESAWTWERMALTRARVIAGSPAMIGRTERGIADALAFRQAPAQILADACAMRARMLHELPATGPWDVKLMHGGGIDVEFIAQALQLAGGRAEWRAGCAPGACLSTRDALRHLAALGRLPAPVAERLIRTDRVWRTLQGMLRILVGRHPGPELPAAAAGRLVRTVDPQREPPLDLAALRARMAATAAEVRSAFSIWVGELP